MTTFHPSSRTAGEFLAGAFALVLAATAADAQATSGQRKSMEFDVVPADPRQPPERQPPERQASGQASGMAAPPSMAAPQAPQGAPTPTANGQAAIWQPAAPSLPAEQAQGPAPAAPAPSVATPAAASGLPAVQAGLLECRGEFAPGYGFGSTRKVSCEFRPTAGEVHYYVGTLERVGLDIGISDQASMLWGVLATSRDLRPGALAGRYSGVSSGFALGPGFSANVLASTDASRQITLQPVSVSSDSGLSLSIAGATLTLEPSASRPR